MNSNDIHTCLSCLRPCLVGGPLAAALVLQVAGQVPHVERFDYLPGTQLNGQTGGTGWSEPWTTTNGSFTVGNFFATRGVISQTDAQHSVTTRKLDTTAIPSAANASGLYGADGSSLMVRFRMQRPDLADPEVIQFGLRAPDNSGLALFTLPGQDALFIGGTNIPPTQIPGTSILDEGLYTIRIDFGPSTDDLYIWSATKNPFTESPDLISDTGFDFRFDTVGLSVQAPDITFNVGFFSDITVRPTPPSCGGAVGCAGQANSVTGTGGKLCARGSIEVADNDLTLVASEVPDGVGIFFHGPGAIPPVAIGNGTVCIAPPHTRLGIGIAVNGEASLPVPTSSFSPGETRVFQFWHRDVSAGGAFFNFTESRVVVFQ